MHEFDSKPFKNVNFYQITKIIYSFKLFSPKWEYSHDRNSRVNSVERFL